MAKNKKPRKQYHKRWRTQKLICDQKEVDAIKETFSDVELAVEMKPVFVKILQKNWLGVFLSLKNLSRGFAPTLRYPRIFF